MRTQVDLQARVLGLGCREGVRNILRDMHARRKQIRDSDDLCGTGTDTLRDGTRDVGFGEFQKRRGNH